MHDLCHPDRYSLLSIAFSTPSVCPPPVLPLTCSLLLRPPLSSKDLEERSQKIDELQVSLDTCAEEADQLRTDVGVISARRLCPGEVRVWKTDIRENESSQAGSEEETIFEPLVHMHSHTRSPPVGTCSWHSMKRPMSWPAWSRPPMMRRIQRVSHRKTSPQ